MLLLCYMLSLVTPTGEALKMSLYKYNDNKGFSILFYSTEEASSTAIHAGPIIGHSVSIPQQQV